MKISINVKVGISLVVDQLELGLAQLLYQLKLEVEPLCLLEKRLRLAVCWCPCFGRVSLSS